MFSLNNQEAKIANLNTRAEKHGDESVKACDLKIECTLHSSVLDCFDKGLRKILYRKPAAGKLFQLVQETREITLIPPDADDAEQSKLAA